MSPDPQKTAAIVKMEKPKTLTELQRFMGMVNQLDKFASTIAEISQPLRELLSSKKAWLWGPPQDEAFEIIRQPNHSLLKGSRKCLSRLGRSATLWQQNCSTFTPTGDLQETLKRIHNGHQGIQRCRLIAKISVWSPGISKEIENNKTVPLLCPRVHLQKRADNSD